jgi:hypothetical protein
MEQFRYLKKAVQGQRRLTGLQLAVRILRDAQFIGHEILGIFPDPPDIMNVFQDRFGAKGDIIHMID